MIYLFTGVPGAGKTSNTLWAFLQDETLKDRPRYATDIPGLDYEAQNITRLDNVEGWQDLPDGSVILIDEADQYLPAKGRDVPDFIRAMARHRHRGFDFYIITQQGTMISHFVRGLVTAHYHYVRVFGEDTVSRFRWEKYQASPDNTGQRKLAQRERIKVDPAVFDLYKSTSVNTRKNEYPAKIYIALIGVPVAIVAAFFIVKWIIFHKVVKEDAQQPAATQVSTAPASSQSGGFLSGLSPSPSAPKVTSYKDLIPRTPYDPSTAPAYDALTAPTDFPRVAACMRSARTGCTCYTQQATPAFVPKRVCEEMVEKGWFDRWQTGRRQQDMQSQPQQLAQSHSEIPHEPTTLVVGADDGPRPVPQYQSIFKR